MESRREIVSVPKETLEEIMKTAEVSLHVFTQNGGQLFTPVGRLIQIHCKVQEILKSARVGKK
jgi:hypothetical protein